MQIVDFSGALAYKYLNLTTSKEKFTYEWKKKSLKKKIDKTIQ